MRPLRRIKKLGNWVWFWGFRPWNPNSDEATFNAGRDVHHAAIHECLCTTWVSGSLPHKWKKLENRAQQSVVFTLVFQVDMKTVIKSKTMYMSLMPAGSRPPDQLLRSLKHAATPESEVQLAQWIMVRERSLGRLRQRERGFTDSVDLDASAGPMSPSSRRLMLFFQVFLTTKAIPTGFRRYSLLLLLCVFIFTSCYLS